MTAPCTTGRERLSKITISLKGLLDEATLKKRVDNAVAAVAQRVVKDCDPFVPFDTGRLAGSVKVTGQGAERQVTYTAPYAKKLYEGGPGMQFNTKKHPQAGSHWFERAKSIWGDQWVQEAERAVKEGK